VQPISSVWHRKIARITLVQNLPASGHAFSKKGMLLAVKFSFEKSGLRGIFLANGEYAHTRTAMVKFQKFTNIITQSTPSNGTCS
jgi:hypothetical protein